MKYASKLLIGLAGISTQSNAIHLEKLTTQTPITPQMAQKSNVPINDIALV
jgi:hypothetical protein